jgi:hypothetical protein
MKNKPRRPSGVGYKVYKNPKEWGNDGYIMYQTGDMIKSRKWYTAENNQINWPTYTTGFHILPTIADAKKFAKRIGKSYLCIVKVEYKEARIVGKDRGCKVIIADKMKIVKRILELE